MQTLFGSFLDVKIKLDGILVFLKEQESCVSLHYREKEGPHTTPTSHTGTEYER
jgi:hypothetical protein